MLNYYLSFLFIVFSSTSFSADLREFESFSLSLQKVIKKIDKIEGGERISKMLPTWGVNTEITGKIFSVNQTFFEIRCFWWETREGIEKPFGEYIEETSQSNTLPDIINLGYGPLFIYKISPPSNAVASLIIKPKVPLEDMRAYPIEIRNLPECDQYKYNHIQFDELLSILPSLSKHTSSTFISSLVGSIIAYRQEKFQIHQAFYTNFNQEEQSIELRELAYRYNLANKLSRTVEFNNISQEIFYWPILDSLSHLIIYISLRRTSS